MRFQIGDEVRLKEDLKHERILARTRGFIVDVRGADEVEVDFVDADGTCIGTTLVSADALETADAIEAREIPEYHDPHAPPETTALLHAVRAGDLAHVRALIASGANPNEMSLYAETPMSVAARSGNLPMVQLLHSLGAYLGTTMADAIVSRSLDLLKWYLAHDQDVHDPIDEDGCTLLMIAASGGDLEQVKLLVAAGAHVNLQQRDGTTALSLAASRNHDDVVDFLWPLCKRSVQQSAKRAANH